MDQTNAAIIAANLPLYLTLSELADPGAVIDKFFNCLTLNDARELLTSVFDAAISQPDDCLGDFSRADLQFSKGEVIRLLEAVLWLNRGQKQAM